MANPLLSQSREDATGPLLFVARFAARRIQRAFRKSMARTHGFTLTHPTRAQPSMVLAEAARRPETALAITAVASRTCAPAGDAASQHATREDAPTAAAFIRWDADALQGTRRARSLAWSPDL